MDEMKTLLLNRSEVASLLDMDRVIAAVEDAYRAFARGEVLQPPIMSIELPERNGEIDFKGGYCRSNDVISMKGASGFWDNLKDRGIPNSLSTVLLFDGTTGALTCVMDGSLITGYRTGAAGGISAKHLARPESSCIAIIGAGMQGRMQIRALSRVLPIKDVFVWDSYAQALPPYKEEMERELGVSVHACATPEEAVRGADAVVTATPGTKPFVEKSWIRPGTHIVAVGADMEGKQELDAALFAGAKIVVDSIAQCTSRGETRNAIEQGVIAPKDIHAEIGEILLGKKPGRENAQEITIFDTTGMAVQDNLTAAAVYESAKTKGLGLWHEFMR